MCIWMMIAIGNDPKEMIVLQENLSKKFEMEDLNLLKYFLGIEISQLNKRIFLSQRNCIIDVLDEADMSTY